MPSPTASIASRTPWSSLTSSCTLASPNVSPYQAIASSRSGTAMPTWSMRRNTVATVTHASGPAVPWQEGRTPTWRRPAVPGSVIVGGARTPMGKLLGGLQRLLRHRPRRGRDQGGAGAGRDHRRPGRLRRSSGQVLQAGAGQMPARQAAVKAGIPMSVPSLLVNKVCLSGLDAIALADQLIGAGEFEVVVAGGMESMTNAPHLLPAPAQGPQVRRGRDARLDGVRRADRRLRPHPDGRVHRPAQRAARASPAPSRTSSPPGRTSGPPPRRRTACSTRRSCRCRSRSGAATRSRSARTRGSAGTPPPRCWPSCGRRSPRTARSPPAARRRSPTARARWW